MMTLETLYKDRRIKDRREQRALFFSFFDWIYLFYIGLPFTIFLVYQYIMIWQGHSQWFEMIQFPAIHLVLFPIIAWSALRTYVKKADQLFLARNTGVMNSLVTKGFLRLIVAELVKIALTVVLILPLLLHYLTKPELFFYIAMLLFFNLFYTMYLYSAWRNKWFTALLCLIYILAGFFPDLWVPLSAVSLALCFYLPAAFHYENKSFNQWLDIEYDKGSRLSKWLFKIASVSMKKEGIELEKGPSRFREIMMYRLSKRGRLFKNRSQRYVLLESFIKWFCRQPAYWVYFFQVLGINLLLLLIHHMLIEIIISIVCCFGVVNILKSLWTRFMTHDFMNLYHWEDTAVAKARDTTQTVLLVIYGTILAIAIMIQQV